MRGKTKEGEEREEECITGEEKTKYQQKREKKRIIGKNTGHRNRGKRQKCSNGNNKRKQANTREGMKRVTAEPGSVSLRTQRKQERSRRLEEMK